MVHFKVNLRAEPQPQFQHPVCASWGLLGSDRPCKPLDCTFQHSDASFLQPSGCLVLITGIFFILLFKQLWKGLEHPLMQFCLLAAYLSYLFSQVLLFAKLCSTSGQVVQTVEKGILNPVLFAHFRSAPVFFGVLPETPGWRSNCSWSLTACSNVAVLCRQTLV